MTTLAQAVAVSELLTCIVLFSLTRLDGIPRSTPAIHALLLWAGLVAARAIAHLAERGHSPSDRARTGSREHVIVIGLNDLAAFFIKFLEGFARNNQRVIAVLDPEPRWIGRAVNGVAILGQPGHLDAIIEEFSTHGVRTDRVVVAGAPDMLCERDLDEVRRVCTRRSLGLEFLPEPFKQNLPEPALGGATRFSAADRLETPLHPSPYFVVKHAVDFAAALLLLIALLPVWSLAALLTWLFVGSPIVFWQQRVGRGGCDFDLYKLRTLRPSVDRSGRRIDEADRLSLIGRLLRQTRADELPQLLNVLVGDMSLVGPRPLLARDQPASPKRRLTVRPGITGWAQVNGGNLLNAKQKQALDEWYIRHASPWLDLRIIVLTATSVLRGDRIRPRALAQAEADIAVLPAGDAGNGMRPSAALGD